MVAAAPICLPQLFACAMRVTQLDANGLMLVGANNMYTSAAFTQNQVTPVYEDGDEFKQKNACGTIAYDVKAPPSYVRTDLQITLTTPDPQLMQLLGGGPVINIVADGRVGGSAPSIGPVNQANQNGVSIEFWAKMYRNNSLAADWPYAWWVFPKVTNLKIGQFNQENGPNLPVISGEAYENTNWYNGPLNDWPVANTPTQSWQWIPSRTIPTPTCGYQTVATT
jgi:hypothetical protein